MKVQMVSIPKIGVVDTLPSNRQNATIQIKMKDLKISDQPIEKMSNVVEPQPKVEKANKEQPEEIRIEVITHEDTEEILTMLKEFFFKDEPMNNYLNMADCKELEEYATKNIGEHCSFKALNSHGEIIGVAMNGIINKASPDEPHHSYAEECKHPQFKKILSLMEYIDERFSTFDLYPTIDKFLDAKILTVNTNYRGYGIAGKLMERTIEYMRDNKIEVIQVFCSSHYSARVCEKMGFNKVFVLPFIDYVVNGENPILPEAPHTAIQILIREIH